MDHVLNFSEHVGVSEYHRITKEIDAVTYRNEFLKFRTGYLESHGQTELIFSFIVLQIYIECFLHQNMRRIVGLEFKPPRQVILNEWIKQERRYVPQKLEHFINLFEPPPSESLHLVEGIKDRFKNISDIRNLLAHGHEISEWSDSEERTGKTEALAILTKSQFAQTEKEINELGLMWNELLDHVAPRCKALNRVDDFKFKKI